MARQRGRFITLEGGDGAGKSTQQRRLIERLGAAGITAVATREPGGSPRAEVIRDALLSGKIARFGPFAETLMFFAARADHLDTVIRPALARGDWVVCDRFTDSTRAYQGVRGQVDATLIRTLERVVVGETRPDLTLVLDLSPEEGLARARARRGADQAGDRFEAEALDFHTELRQAFLAIARDEKDRCAVIDATQDRDAVADAIWTAVGARLIGTTAQVRRRATRAAAV
jgi:dTMP kinase